MFKLCMETVPVYVNMLQQIPSLFLLIKVITSQKYAHHVL